LLKIHRLDLRSCQPRQGQNRFEAVAEAQEDFNEMVQEAAARFQPGKEWLTLMLVDDAMRIHHHFF